MVSSIALSSAIKFISLVVHVSFETKKLFTSRNEYTYWLWTIDVAHTSSSTSGSPFLRNSAMFDSACWTACLVLLATVRQTSRTASRRAISSLIAGSPAKRSDCCARNLSASRASAWERELSSEDNLR